MKKAAKKKALQHVVIRSYSSGVFAGDLVSVCQSGAGRQRVVMNGSRRFWKWVARDGIALSGLAAHGAKVAECKIDTAIDGHTIDDVIEIIPTSKAAQETLR